MQEVKTVQAAQAKEGDSVELKDGRIVDVVEVNKGTKTYYVETHIADIIKDPSTPYEDFTISMMNVVRVLPD